MNTPQDISNTLPRSERLRRRGALSELFSEGDSGFVFPLRYLWIRKSEESGVTLLFSVPKRLHKRANKRNLLRRRIKESYRVNKSLLSSVDGGVHLALIYSTKELLDSSRISDSVERILQKLSTTITNQDKDILL